MKTMCKFVENNYTNRKMKTFILFVSNSFVFVKLFDKCWYCHISVTYD